LTKEDYGGQAMSVPSVIKWFLFAIGRVLFRDLFLSIPGRKKFEGFGVVNYLWKPRWYDT